MFSGACASFQLHVILIPPHRHRGQEDVERAASVAEQLKDLDVAAERRRAMSMPTDIVLASGSVFKPLRSSFIPPFLRSALPSSALRFFLDIH